MHFLEKKGRNVDEAIKSALDELQCTIEQVIVTVIETESRGFFGFGSKEAKISVVKKFNPELTAKNFINEVMSAIGLNVNINMMFKDDKHLNIELDGENISALIGKRGQTLESLQHLISLVVNKGQGPYVNVILDIADYREKRKETLEKLALNLAKKAKSTDQSVVLEPMISSERRIIHIALQNHKYVYTQSQGEEPYRNVVILPK